MICPRCQTDNPPAARFCMQCGARLPHGDDSQPAAQPEPARSHTPVEGERRVITILFCDVVESTALAAQLDPEVWAEIMNEAFRYLVSPIHRYQGTVARLMGDAVLAFFGAPAAHEDDPLRAILAGLDIVHGLEPFRQRIQRDHGLDFNVRVGINTGPVVVGEIGPDRALEYTAMGDAINVAARLEQAAAPGTVLVSEATRSLAGAQVAFEAVGPVTLRGKAEPTAVFRALRRQEAPTARHEGKRLEAALVGRSQELATLKAAVDGLLAGRGQIVTLLGEAGVGKSRLVAELRRAAMVAAGEDLRWIAARGISYERDRPYGMFQQWLRQVTGVAESDHDQAARRKLQEQAHAFPPASRQQMVAAAQVLLAVEAGPGESRPTGEALKQELFAAFLQTWRAWAEAAPLVTVFDDLQWADAASVELLQHLFPLVEQAPILFLCSLRPDEDTPGWRVVEAARAQRQERATELSLAPLSAADMDRLTAGLLGIAEAPPPLKELVLQKTGGNPFYVEEVLSKLIEDGVLAPDPSGAGWQLARDARDIAVPNTVQGLLMARFDGLSAPARHALQTASVVGRSFSYRVLDAMLADAEGGNGDLPGLLDRLQRAGLIVGAASDPEPIYAFRHDLTRDAAYGSILHRQRRLLHQRVAQVIEGLYPERLDEEAHLLAHHYAEAQEHARALHYAIRAGHAAARLHANAEAVAQFSRAIELAGHSEASTAQLLDVYTSRGRALELSGRYADALQNYDELETQAGKRDDRALALSALVARSTLYAAPTATHDPGLARTTSGQALALARELDDREAEAKILWNLMLLHKFTGEPRLAIEYGEASLAIAREQGLKAQQAYALNDLAIYGYLDTAGLDRALSSLEEAQELWQELDNQPMLADNLGSHVIVHYLSGNFDAAIRAAREARRLSLSIGNLWGQSYSRWAVGDVYFEQGEMEQAIAALEECIAVGEQAGFVAGAVAARIKLAWVYGYLGRPDEGVHLAQRAHAIAQSDLPGWRQWPLAVLARLHVLQGDIPAAEAASQGFAGRFQESFLDEVLPFIAVSTGFALAELALARQDPAASLATMEALVGYLQRSGTRAYRPEALLLQGRSLLLLGQSGPAADVLEAALEAAQDTGSRYCLWTILAARAEIEAQVGNHAQATRLRQDASRAIAFIAHRIGSPELRQSFLARPDVQPLA